MNQKPNRAFELTTAAATVMVLLSFAAVAAAEMPIPRPEAKPAAQTVDWWKMMTVAKVKRDEQGRLLPLQPYLQPDNRIVVGFQYNQWWYSCHAGVVLYLLDFEKGPDKEN
jgi:hypothetical protein